MQMAATDALALFPDSVERRALAGIVDPPRAEAKVAIAEAEKPKGPTLQELLDRLNAATTLEDLKTSVVQASLLSDPDKATLKVAYLAKQTALKGAQ